MALCLASAGANNGNTLGAVYPVGGVGDTLGAAYLVGGVVAIRILPSGKCHLEELLMLLSLLARTWCISTVCYSLIAGQLLLIISGASGLVWLFGGGDYFHCVLELRRLFSFLCFLVLCHNANICMVDYNSALRGLSRSCVTLIEIRAQACSKKKIRCTCVHPCPMLGPPLLQSSKSRCSCASLLLLLLMPVSWRL